MHFVSLKMSNKSSLPIWRFQLASSYPALWLNLEHHLLWDPHPLSVHPYFLPCLTRLSVLIHSCLLLEFLEHCNILVYVPASLLFKVVGGWDDFSVGKKWKGKVDEYHAVSQSLFYCCYKAPWPRELADGKAYLGWQFQGNKSPWWQQALQKEQKPRAHIVNSKHETVHCAVVLKL